MPLPTDRPTADPGSSAPHLAGEHRITLVVCPREGGRFAAFPDGSPLVFVEAETREAAIQQVRALALRALANRVERGEVGAHDNALTVTLAVVDSTEVHVSRRPLRPTPPR